MGNRFVLSILGIGAVLPLSFATSAKAQQPRAGNQAQAAKAQAFNPHDLAGIWSLAPRRQMAISLNRPPLTAWGKEKLAMVKGSFANKALGIVAFPEKEWNDPLFQCDPAGYPRTMQQVFGEIFRFVPAANEVVQFFEWDHTYRDIWTDGRKLYDDPERRYYGFAVGRWNGDTFVVDSNGFNGRTWLDPWGDIHSDEMRLHETFRRVDQDSIEWTITVEDPKTYMQPWVSNDKRVFKLVPKSPRSEVVELREDFCVWSDSRGFFGNVDTVGIGDAPARGGAEDAPEK